MSRPQFVLVHGAWHGAWCWRDVLPLLRDAGHIAHAVTLTGLAERAHLMSPDIRLSTHATDVAALVHAEELSQVILVGHSYGGMVITAAADLLLRQAREQGVASPLHHLVYVDAVTPRPGESWSSTHAPATIDQRLKAAQVSGGLSIPPADSAVFGLSGAQRDWVNRRQTPQPLGVYQDPLDFDPAGIAALPRTFIDCVAPALPTIAVMRQRVRSEPGWRVIEMQTGHDPMVTEPAALAELLLQAAS